MSTESLKEILAKAGSAEHRRRALEKLARRTTATYGSDPAEPGVILEYSPDGNVRRGRFVDRQFVARATSRPEDGTVTG